MEMKKTVFCILFVKHMFLTKLILDLLDTIFVYSFEQIIDKSIICLVST